MTDKREGREGEDDAVALWDNRVVPGEGEN